MTRKSAALRLSFTWDNLLQRVICVNLVVVSYVFPPEPVGASRTSFDLARELAARGHDVTVIAPFPNRPAGRLYAGYRRALFRREAAPEGFRIVRCASFFSRRSSMLSRLAENVSFGVTSSLALLFCGRPEVIYANTWPIFAAAMNAIVARLRRIPLVISVQDIYPESLASQRRPGSGVLTRVLVAIDRRVVRGAAAVVVISETFAEHYRRLRGVDPARLHVVRNWLSAEGTEEDPAAAGACRDRHGIPRAAFLLVYGGSVGRAAAVETAIEAVRDLDDVYFLIAGEGASLDDCRRLAARIAPERVRFENPWPGTMDVLHAADALVLPTLAGQSAVSVPSKLIGYLLAGRPVVAAVLDASDTAATVLDSGAGLVVAPGDPRRLAEAIRAMRILPADERRRMGRAGRTWAVANVTAEACLPRLVDVIEEASRGSLSSPAGAAG
ncbi:MAG TPA: glycosyltransferase family 4 protein [Vicinamibacterales bacterium]